MEYAQIEMLTKALREIATALETNADAIDNLRADHFAGMQYIADELRNLSVNMQGKGF